MRLRSSGAMSSYTAARTIGCTNPSGSWPVRISAPRRASTAVPASSVEVPASDAARVALALSPSTATARASAGAAAGSRPSRRSTTRETPCGPSASTRAASLAVGAIRSEATSRISSLISSGLPLVAAWQARQNSSSALVAQGGADPLDHRVAGQRGGRQVPRGRARGQHRQQVAQRLLAGARAHQQQHRQVLQPRGQEVQEAQRRVVGPVGVVHRQQQRPVAGQVRAQPVQAVQARVVGVARTQPLQRLGGIEHRLHQLGRARVPRPPARRATPGRAPARTAGAPRRRRSSTPARCRARSAREARARRPRRRRRRAGSSCRCRPGPGPHAGRRAPRWPRRCRR